MPCSVLVLTNSQDGTHSDVVVEKLRRRGAQVFRLDVDRLAAGEIKASFRAGLAGNKFEFRSGSEAISSEEVKSVWYRRPHFFNFSIGDPVQKGYAEKEMDSFLGGLWVTLRDAFWVNDPAKLDLARKKVFQLALARELGFMVPRTLISNNPAEVRDFLADCEGRVVFKAIHIEFLDFGERKFNIPTTLLAQEHLGKLDLVSRMPSLFQEFIDKAYELRVTIVGERVFSVRIDSQDNPQTLVDWRHPSHITTLRHTVVHLPQDIQERCLKLLRELGLVFAAIDIAVSKTGEFWFLEINPNAQWYWIEDFTGVLISDAIVDTLIEALGNRQEGR